MDDVYRFCFLFLALDIAITAYTPANGSGSDCAAMQIRQANAIRVVLPFPQGDIASGLAGTQAEILVRGDMRSALAELAGSSLLTHPDLVSQVRNALEAPEPREPVVLIPSAQWNEKRLRGVIWSVFDLGPVVHERRRLFVRYQNRNVGQDFALELPAGANLPGIPFRAQNGLELQAPLKVTPHFWSREYTIDYGGFAMSPNLEFHVVYKESHYAVGTRAAFREGLFPSLIDEGVLPIDAVSISIANTGRTAYYRPRGVFVHDFQQRRGVEVINNLLAPSSVPIVRLSADGNILVFASGHELIAFRLEARRFRSINPVVIGRANMVGNSIQDITVSPDGTRVLVEFVSNRVLELFQLIGGRFVRINEIRNANVRCDAAAISQDNTKVLIAGDATIDLWDVGSNGGRHVMAPAPRGIKQIFLGTDSFRVIRDAGGFDVVAEDRPVTIIQPSVSP